jgi:hypothetical protein
VRARETLRIPVEHMLRTISRWPEIVRYNKLFYFSRVAVRRVIFKIDSSTKRVPIPPAVSRYRRRRERLLPRPYYRLRRRT